MNTHYINREIDDFSDAPAVYEFSPKKEGIGALMAILACAAFCAVVIVAATLI